MSIPYDTTVASISGSAVYIWDTNSWTQIDFIRDAHVGNTYSLARSRTGKFIFTGGEDGAIHMFEITGTDHCNGTDVLQVATWIPHTGTVYSLAFECPWLVSATSDSKLSLIDVRKLLKTSRRTLKKNTSRADKNQESLEPPQWMLHGFECNLFSVDIGADRSVCGGKKVLLGYGTSHKRWKLSKGCVL